MGDMYYVYIFAKWLVNSLSLKHAYNLACFMADIKFFFRGRDRKLIEKNLEIVFGGKTAGIERTSREVLRNFARYLVDFFRSKEIDESFLKERVEITNTEYVREARSHKKGVIVFSCHIGNWEMGGQIFSSTGNPVYGVALVHPSKRVNDFFNNQRLRGGLEVFPLGKGKNIVRLLKENKMVVLLGDRDFSNTAIDVEFFGRKAYLPAGPGFFASRLGSPLLPVFCVRKNTYNYKMIYGKPIYPENKDMRTIVQEGARVLEDVIKKYPDQWYPFGDLWKEK